MTSVNRTAPQFADLFNRALAEPGIISRAYSAFHGYSIGNQILALVQCAEREITPGPIATFMGWKEKGRYVRKGEKAITLCQPVTVKRNVEQEDNADKTEVFTRFIYRPHWFVLSQTDGQDVQPPATPEWDQARALETFGITEEPFTTTDGNCQGYARQRTIAVSPLAELPHKTRFHELAHVLLGHTSGTYPVYFLASSLVREKTNVGAVLSARGFSDDEDPLRTGQNVARFSNVPPGGGVFDDASHRNGGVTVRLSARHRKNLSPQDMGDFLL
jgi:hypothetical protein